MRLIVLPPPCPLGVQPIDFGHADELIGRALSDAREFLDDGGAAKPRVRICARDFSPRADQRSRGYDSTSPRALADGPRRGVAAHRADLRGGAGRDRRHAGDGGLRSPRGGPGAPGSGGHGAHADARCRHRLADVAQARQRAQRGDGRRRLGGPGPVQAVDGELAPICGRSACRAAAPRPSSGASARPTARACRHCSPPGPIPRWAGAIARDGFAPAMRRFDAAIAALAQEQDGIARAAQQRTWLGWLGSLTIGLLLLCLLGWRMHRIQRRSAVAEQARDAERRGEERLHALVRHSSDVVAVVDGTSQIRWIAESVRGALGYDPADVDRRPVDGPRPRRRRRRRDALPGEGRAEARTCRLAERAAARRRRRLSSGRGDRAQPHRRSADRWDPAQLPRRLRSRGARGATPPPGVPRRPHGPRQPGAVRGSPDAGALARPAPRWPARGGLRRSRRLQDGQ